MNNEENWPTLLEETHEVQVELDLLLYNDQEKDPNLQQNYDEEYL